MRLLIAVTAVLILTGFLRDPALAYKPPINDRYPLMLPSPYPATDENSVFSAGKEAVSRLDLDTSVLAESGLFRVHYDSTGFHSPPPADEDKNGIPDYVDSTLVYLQYAWDLQVGDLGYLPPLEDNGEDGGPEIDIYIREYGSTGGYGSSEGVYTDQGLAAYIFIDNDYSESQYRSKGYDGLKVSTAHELFHAVQFRYLHDTFALRWWMEQTAVWMEDYAWSDVNDYLAYNRYFFADYRFQPLDSTTYLMYGAGIWPMYLAKKFGPGIIRTIWEALAASDTPGIDLFDSVLPSGFEAAFEEFRTWNFFTKNNANTTDFYPDGDLFEYTVMIDHRSYFAPASDNLQCNYLNGTYAEFYFVGQYDDNDALSLAFTPTVAGDYSNTIIFFNDSTHYEIRKIPVEGGEIPLMGTWNRAVLVTSCTSTSGVTRKFTFNAEIKADVGVDEAEPVTFNVNSAYPNPFNPATTISFTLPRDGHVTVSVYNSAGQHVSNLFGGEMSTGEKRIFWRPESISAGVYFVRIATADGIDTIKTLYMK